MTTIPSIYCLWRLARSRFSSTDSINRVALLWIGVLGNKILLRFTRMCYLTNVTTNVCASKRKHQFLMNNGFRCLCLNIVLFMSRAFSRGWPLQEWRKSGQPNENYSTEHTWLDDQQDSVDCCRARHQSEQFEPNSLRYTYSVQLS